MLGWYTRLQCRLHHKSITSQSQLDDNSITTLTSCWIFNKLPLMLGLSFKLRQRFFVDSRSCRETSWISRWFSLYLNLFARLCVWGGWGEEKPT